MKSLKLLLFLSIVVKTCLSQEIKNMTSICQTILNDPKYVEAILSDSSFLCEGNSLVLFTNSDTSSTLTFMGKPIVIKGLSDSTKCPILAFTLHKYNNKKYQLTAAVYRNYGRSGTCFFSKSILYTCTLKKKRDAFLIQHPRISGNGMRGYLM